MTMPLSSDHWDHEPIPSPSREGIVPLGQFPSWEGPGVGLSATGSWKAPFRLFSACIGTLNQIVLLLVLVLEDQPSNRGRRREVDSWKAHANSVGYWNHEPVGRVTPCAPQFGNAQTARRGLTRPTFRFMESPIRFGACIGSKRNQPRQEPVTRTVRMLLSRGAVGPFEKLSPFCLH